MAKSRWAKGRAAVDHAIVIGQEATAIEGQLEGLRTEDPRRTALSDQHAATKKKQHQIVRQALRHGVDAEHLADKLDEHEAR
jgi:hypothetical protein